MNTVHIFDFTNCPDPPTPTDIWASRHARREREEQGLPPRVTNPAVLERLAVLTRERGPL